ncbi:MAG: YkgJ family cysteine cluster protein [Deltaproteobacteria bacterium]|nr:MAG: YkgJ family cysteine cluster protein [Deltaproteobacteria bacterium]
MERWYRGGLRFACTECGACCTGGAGYTWVGEADAARLAAQRGLSLDAFGRRYLRRVGERYALLEDRRTGDCVFLERGRCSVYAARPAQCRAYPFWPRNLASREAWNAAARECEGIRDDAPLIPAERIRTYRTQ